MSAVCPCAWVVGWSIASRLTRDPSVPHGLFLNLLCFYLYVVKIRKWLSFLGPNLGLRKAYLPWAEFILNKKK